MKPKLLTEEQIVEVAAPYYERDTPKFYAVAKEQAKVTLSDILIWRDEPCPHDDGKLIKSACPRCWQALKQLAGEQ